MVLNKRLLKLCAGLTWIILLMVLFLVATINTMRTFGKHVPLFVGIGSCLGVFLFSMLSYWFWCLFVYVRDINSQSLSIRMHGVGEEDYKEMKDQEIQETPDTDPEVLQGRRKKKNFARKCLWETVVVLTVTLNIVILVIFSMYLFVQQNAVPSTSGTLSLRGLTDDVLIERQPNGFIHITAQNEHDLLFAQGVVHMQERMFQMEFQKRVTEGTLSEILGSAAVDQDKLLRTQSLFQAGELGIQNASPQTLRVLDAYIEGINAYLDSNPPKTIEFHLLDTSPQKWTPVNSATWLKMLAGDLAENLGTELQRLEFLSRGLSKERVDQLFPRFGKGIPNAPVIIPDEEVFQFRDDFDDDDQVDTAHFQPEVPLDTAAAAASSHQQEEHLQVKKNVFLDRLISRNLHTPFASNSFVVHGDHTESGKPILANDPHLEFNAPNNWIQHHLKCEPCGIDAIGIQAPGVPVLAFGHTKFGSWSITDGGADTQDVFVMQDSEDGQGYIHNGTERQYITRNEIIKVKGQKDITFPVRTSVYGPVINNFLDFFNNLDDIDRTKSYSLRWSILDPNDTTADGFIEMLKVKTAKEFVLSAAKVTSFVINFSFAGTNGDIAYFATGSVPKRVPGHTGLYPVPGTGEFDWTVDDYVAPENHPQMINPKQGFIVTGNNEVVHNTTSQDYRNIDYRNSLYRPLRMTQLVNKTISQKKFTIEDAMMIQRDVKSVFFDQDLRPFLAQLDVSSSKEAMKWQKILMDWDAVMSHDTKEPAVFSLWYIELTKLPAVEILNAHWDDRGFILQALKEGDHACDLRSVSCIKFASDAFITAVDKWNKNNWKDFGEGHPQRWSHLVFGDIPILKDMFNREVVSRGGDDQTVNNGGMTFPGEDAKDQRLVNTHGPVLRYIADLSDVENSIYNVPIGENGSPTSRHYDNILFDSYQFVNYQPMKLSGYNVHERQTLKPNIA